MFLESALSQPEAALFVSLPLETVTKNKDFAKKERCCKHLLSAVCSLCYEMQLHRDLSLPTLF